MKKGHTSETLSGREGCVSQAEQRSIQGVDGDGGPHAAMQGVLLARSAHHLLVGAINYPKFEIR